MSQSNSNETLIKVIKNSINDSSFIIQMKVLRYLTNEFSKGELSIIDNILSEVKPDVSNYLQIMNIFLIVEFFKSIKNKDFTKISKFFETFQKYDKDKLLKNSVEEFFIICNFIESFFAFFEIVNLDMLLYLRNKLKIFMNKEDVQKLVITDKFHINIKRQEEIRCKLFYDYYEIIVNYLIRLKTNKCEDDLLEKVCTFIININDYKTNVSFDLVHLIEKNIQIINANLISEKDKIQCHEVLLSEVVENPKLKELHLVITLYLSNQYYKNNNYNAAIEKILPIIKILKEEIYIEENPFGNKNEVLDNLLLLYTRLINCYYYNCDEENMNKFIRKLHKFISILRKSKLKENSNDENILKSLLSKYECMLGIYSNILNLGMIDRSKLKKELMQSIQKNSNSKNNLNPQTNFKLQTYDNILNYLEKYKKTNFLEIYPNNSFGFSEEINRILFDKLLNYFMFMFEKYINTVKERELIHKFYMSNLDSLKNIKIYLDNKILKEQFENNRYNPNEINKLLSKNQKSLQSYFYLLIGNYNLIYFYHSLIKNETDEKRKVNYYNNLSGLCEHFLQNFKTLFAPVLLTLQYNDNNGTPMGSDSSEDNDILNLKILIENNKIKNILLKIFFIHLNSFKYMNYHDQAMRLFEEYERILLNFDLKDEISEKLYVSILKLKGDFFIRRKNYLNGLNVYFEILKILDKNVENFMEDKAIISFNTGFAYLLKLKNNIEENPQQRNNAKEELANVKNYLQESLNLFETIKYNRNSSINKNFRHKQSFSHNQINSNGISVLDNLDESDLNIKIEEVRNLLKMIQ